MVSSAQAFGIDLSSQPALNLNGLYPRVPNFNDCIACELSERVWVLLLFVNACALLALVAILFLIRRITDQYAHTHTHTHIHSLTHSHAHTLSLSLSLSHTHTLAHIRIYLSRHAPNTCVWPCALTLTRVDAGTPARLLTRGDNISGTTSGKRSCRCR